MSLFENPDYQWRETFFVLFDSKKRPTLKKLQQALRQLNPRFSFANAVADERGMFESITIISPEDFAALDICYVEGEEVQETVAKLVEDISKNEPTPANRKKLRQIRNFDGRFDVLHFEQVVDFDDEDVFDTMFDPGTLITVLDALVKMTSGVAYDPQSGTFV